ncbi:MAG TPA: helix-turn-helix transcriptional regulator [Polyangiaceae bacterium]|jgi:DNA-binding CsgD family transcriptional regulator
MGDRSLADKLQAILPLLRRGLVSDGDAEELFDRLRDTIGATGFALGQDLDYRGWGVFRGIPEQWMRDHTRLRNRDPSIPLLRRTPPGYWYASQRETARQPIDPEFADRFFASGLKEIALAKLYSPFRDDLFFWMVRTDRCFEEPELALLELLYPHLASALATRRALALLGDGAATRPPSVFVSFPEGAVQADTAARRAIERRTGPLGAIGWQKVTRAIAAAAARFAHAAGGRSQTLWPGLNIDFASMRPGRGESARLVGFLVDEDDFAPPPDRAPPLVEALLSPRQLAVARDFAAGMAVMAIAEARRILVETVRTHLREIRRRLGVRDRAGVARALAE